MEKGGGSLVVYILFSVLSEIFIIFSGAIIILNTSYGNLKTPLWIIFLLVTLGIVFRYGSEKFRGASPQIIESSY